MVAITADYRVSSRHRTTPADSVQDGKSAMSYVRANATRLGIDPERIVASGGSAGGLIAACVGVIPDLDQGDEETSVSYTPNAMVLFNPAIMGKSSIRRPEASGRPSFTKEIMPYYHVREGLPPLVVVARLAARQEELIDWNKARELHQRAQRDETLTAEEQAYYEPAKAARHASRAQGAARALRPLASRSD